MTERIYNHIPDSVDERDFLYAPRVLKLASSVDLRSKFPPVFDQGQLGSCTANGILGWRGYCAMASGDSYTELSRLFLYWEERFLEGTVGQDSGAMIRDGFKVLNTLGCALESDYPYDVTNFTATPSSAALAYAGHFKIDSYNRVLTLADLKAALSSAQPVVFGFTVYESFESFEVANGGVVPMPNTATEQILGGHCVVAVGYDDSKNWAIVRNSWGADWGDHGYCYMPYAMFESSIVSDMWTGVIKTPVVPTSLTFLQAIQHYANAGVIDNPPTYWIGFDARLQAGKLLPDDYKYLELLVQKLAARDITLTGL